VDGTVWRTVVGTGCGYIMRQTVELTDEWMDGCLILSFLLPFYGRTTCIVQLTSNVLHPTFQFPLRSLL
jgi:hypothetical protein